MNKENKKKQMSRRAFLRNAGLGAGASGVAAVALAGSRPAEAAAESASGRPAAGYRETEHVRRVYALSRF
ncbi:MAG: formate dehydrogenase [Rhodospirillales bacterium]|nr:formate dehydrogenase [Rhodospirillales bacterium]